jgi:hypothetical protein
MDSFVLEQASTFQVFTRMSRWSRDSAVGIATGYGLDNQGVGFRVPVGARIFSTASRPALPSTQPLMQWVMGAASRG